METYNLLFKDIVLTYIVSYETYKKNKSVLIFLFKLIKHIKRDILVKSKKIALFNDLCTGPPRRMISRSKLWREVTARNYGLQGNDFGDTAVVTVRASYRIKFRVSTGCTERVEPFDTRMVSR
jgi:hypothetical protein